MSNKIKVGILALGRAGWNIHVKGLRDREDFQIVEVADPEEQRRLQAKAELGCEAYPDLETMLAKGSADLIVVATPSTFHERDALAVIAAGKDCVLEKPIATSYAGAKKIADAAAAAGTRLFVHHQHLFSDEYQFLREIISSGILGEVHGIRYNWASYSRRNDWQTLKANGGGLLNNHGPHALTTALDLLDSPVECLCASVQHIKDAGDADDHAHLFIKAKSGRIAELFLSTSCALPLPRTILLGSCGTLIADHTEAKLRFYDSAKAPALEVVDGHSKERKYGNADVLPWQEETRKVVPSKPVGNFYDNVSAVIREGAKMTVSPESALEVTRAIEWAATGEDPVG
ncbi:MAG TPA: Gfo/Idh/MocA family oxidoreductase [Chthoniobacteraceae bacterium]|nr:Gfo/Idh/MocA family oxidoreductase [Chthoniobacteraceae bacterium]